MILGGVAFFTFWIGPYTSWQTRFLKIIEGPRLILRGKTVVFPQYLQNRLSYRLQTGSKNLQIDLLKKSCNGDDIVASTVLVQEVKMYL